VKPAWRRYLSPRRVYGVLKELGTGATRAELRALKAQLRDAKTRSRALHAKARDLETQTRALKGTLREAKIRGRDLETTVTALQHELGEANAVAAQRAVALQSLATGDMHALAAPVVEERRLQAIAREHGEAYRHADPFPHIVLDELFSASLLDRVLEEFERMDRRGWHVTDLDRERKWSTEDPRALGPFTSALIAQLNAGPFVRFLEELSGISGLLPDPHLRGGGLHEIRAGGRLGVHADFNLHRGLKLYRRLNLLVYLNKDWDANWGGDLELWDRTGTRCVRTIEPVFNRAVLFDTSNFSYHGHPHPLACPPDRSRKSVALYYYSADYPFPEDTAAHGTIFI
jgi:hypothetical protein